MKPLPQSSEELNAELVSIFPAFSGAFEELASSAAYEEEVKFHALTLLAAITIALYGTWLYRYRLRAGGSKGLAFREWLKNLSDAVFGL